MFIYKCEVVTSLNKMAGGISVLGLSYHALSVTFDALFILGMHISSMKHFDITLMPCDLDHDSVTG